MQDPADEFTPIADEFTPIADEIARRLSAAGMTVAAAEPLSSGGISNVLGAGRGRALPHPGAP